MIGTYKGWVRVLIFTVMAALTAPLILQGAGDTDGTGSAQKRKFIQVITKNT